MKNNPTIKDSTLTQALAHAEKKRDELPHVVQVWPSDWDLCVLADEIYRLRELIKINKPLPPQGKLRKDHI